MEIAGDNVSDGFDVTMLLGKIGYDDVQDSILAGVLK